MGDLIIPDSAKEEVKPEEVAPENKTMVCVITQSTAIQVDEEELQKAKKEIQAKSSVLITGKEVEVAIQRQLAGWANWFAMFYPKMPKTVDYALKMVGYRLVKDEEKT